MVGKKHPETLEMFQSRLDQVINMNHPLVKLDDAIDWSFFEKVYPKHYSDDQYNKVLANTYLYFSILNYAQRVISYLIEEGLKLDGVERMVYPPGGSSNNILHLLKISQLAATV